MGERLQKLIASAGVTSRRKAEELIRGGRVTVNGELVQLGARADADADEIRVDGRLLPRPARVVLIMHKPIGVVTSVSDPHASRVIVDLLGDEITERVYPAGRLDQDSEGLVILTNDGELMNAITRPGGGVDKEYRVDVAGDPSPESLAGLRAGAVLAGRQLLPCAIDVQGRARGGTTLRIVLHEGKNNQIRRMFRGIGHRVRRLVRVRIGPLHLGELAAGRYRHLTPDEQNALRQAAAGETP